MSLRIDAASDCGCVRSRNEDMVLVGSREIRDDSYEIGVQLSETDRLVIAVADGMGGQQGGDIASEMVVRHLSCYMESLPPGLDSKELRAYFSLKMQQLHGELLAEGERQPQLWGMGSTLTGLLCYEGACYTFNVGDSRIYRFRDGVLRQLTVDHALSNLSGNATVSSHAIYNSVGGAPSMFVDMEEITAMIYPGDQFLLCSDGLYDMLPDAEIERLLSANQTAGSFVDAAKQAGGGDNVSLVLVNVIHLH